MEKKISEDSLKQTVSILKERNITISEDTVNRNMQNMFYLNLSNPFSAESVNFKNITGKVEIKENFYTFIPENSSCSFKNLMLSSQTGEDILDILKNNGISSKYFVWDGTLDMGEGVYRATYYQNYESLRLYSSKLNVFFKEDKILRVEGNYFNILSVSSLENKIISPLDILINLSSFDFKENVTVNSIERGYYTESIYSSYSSLTAIPCYRVVLNNGNEFYFDATNGDFIELSKF